MAQVSDEGLFATIDSESNSIAIIVKHLGRQHALALDRFPRRATAKSRIAIAIRNLKPRRKHAKKSWRSGNRVGSSRLTPWRR